MDFEKVLACRIEKIQSTLVKKAIEYATDSDQFHNFNSAARILGTTPEKALLGMMIKHFVSVLDLVSQTEPAKPAMAFIDEKIGDTINYLILLEGLLKRKM